MISDPFFIPPDPGDMPEFSDDNWWIEYGMDDEGFRPHPSRQGDFEQDGGADLIDFAVSRLWEAHYRREGLIPPERLL